MKISKKLAVGVGALALAAPAAAVAASGSDSGKSKTANYNVKGTYAGEGIVSVVKGNGAVKKAGWKGQGITFDFSQADIRVEDNNLDGEENLADLAVGSEVRVKARLPKGDPGAGPYLADRLDDKSGGDDDEVEVD